MKRLFYSTFIVLFLSSCATTTIVKFDPVANKNLHTIGLVVVLNNGFGVYDFAGTEEQRRTNGILTNLILDLAEEANSTAKKEFQSILTKETSDSGFNFGRQMTEELANALRDVNYEVIILTPSEINTATVDAYLEVELQRVGYRFNRSRFEDTHCDFCAFPLIAANVSLSKFPLITLTLEERKNQSKENTLYLFPISYGDANSTISPPGHYLLDFRKPEHQELIIEGLQHGTAAIAEYVATNLRK